MPYATNADIVTRLGNNAALQLTTDSGSTIDTALIDSIITEVEGTINGFVSKRTEEAITQAAHPATFAALRGHSIAMTIFRLASRRPPVSDDRKARNEQATAWVAKLVAGDVDFPDAALNGTVSHHGGQSQLMSKMRDL